MNYSWHALCDHSILHKNTNFCFTVEIVDGNVKMTLGMIWTIILRFAIQDISVEGKNMFHETVLKHLCQGMLTEADGLFKQMITLLTTLSSDVTLQKLISRAAGCLC